MICAENVAPEAGTGLLFAPRWAEKRRTVYCTALTAGGRKNPAAVRAVTHIAVTCPFCWSRLKTPRCKQSGRQTICHNSVSMGAGRDKQLCDFLAPTRCSQLRHNGMCAGATLGEYQRGCPCVIIIRPVFVTLAACSRNVILVYDECGISFPSFKHLVFCLSSRPC